ncbi:phosphotransferase [Pseudahrensia aquimaris]|uniref:Phosphotransferase n=1 Tax=Pseudahrensia aquimaris TaxID=744461 RepID=A0ABW3FH91_9HYPH
MNAATIKKSSDVMNEDRTAEVAALAKKAFGREPKRVAFPGGTSRSAFVADMEDGIYVFADRKEPDAAQLEGIVLRNLGPSGSVPKLQGVYGNWVVQEFVGGARLPVALDDAKSAEERELLVDLSLVSLLNIHEQARSLNLAHRVPKAGTAENWLWNRTGVAKRISRSAGIDIPDLDREKLVKLMDVKRDEFIKWDARPGNALYDGERVIWFDWEDCVRSKALDDLAFVLFDEWTNIEPEAENRLMEKYLPLYTRGLSPQRAEHYLRLFGVTHCMLRLRRALKLHRRENKWWDRDYCLQHDKVGVTHEESSRIINRIRRLSDGVEEWKPLQDWTLQVAQHYKLDVHR